MPESYSSYRSSPMSQSSNTDSRRSSIAAFFPLYYLLLHNGWLLITSPVSFWHNDFLLAAVKKPSMMMKTTPAVTETFHLFDADGSGCVSKEEFARILCKLGLETTVEDLSRIISLVTRVIYLNRNRTQPKERQDHPSVITDDAFPTNRAIQVTRSPFWSSNGCTTLVNSILRKRAFGIEVCLQSKPSYCLITTMTDQSREKSLKKRCPFSR